MTPLLLTGLAVAIAFRMQLWNIGAEGQLYLGAVAAPGVALFLLPDAQQLGPDPGHADCRRDRRRALGRGSRRAAGEVQRQRDDHDADAQLRRDPLHASTSSTAPGAIPRPLASPAPHLFRTPPPCPITRPTASTSASSSAWSRRSSSGRPPPHPLRLRDRRDRRQPPRRPLRRHAHDPHDHHRHRDQWRTGRDRRHERSRRHRPLAPALDLARLRLHRDHRRLARPSQPVRDHRGQLPDVGHPGRQRSAPDRRSACPARSDRCSRARSSSSCSPASS